MVHKVCEKGTNSPCMPDIDNVCKQCCDIDIKATEKRHSLGPAVTPGSVFRSLDVKLSAVMSEFDDTKEIISAAASHALVRGNLELAQRLLNCLG